MDFQAAQMRPELEGIARDLFGAARSVCPVPQIAAQFKLTIAEAYAIQAMTLAMRLDEGERAVGLKVGFTSRAKMLQMGVSTTIFGHLTDAMAVEEGDRVAQERFIHPRVEPEIAFCLRSALRGRVTLVEAMAAVEFIAAAVEIIDSRFKDFKFSLTDVIADNSSSAGFVIGAPHSARTDLLNTGMVFSTNGIVRQVGSTAAILGNPWRSVVAAAAYAEQYNFELTAGDFILAGAATEAVGVSPGAVVTLEAQSLSAVRFGFTGTTE